MRKKRFSSSFHLLPPNGQRLERLKRPPFDQASQYPIVQACHATVRMIASVAAVLTFVSTLQGPSAFAQSQPVPVIQEVPFPSPARGTAAKSDPSEILGIRIESNGALITGPVNARRVYIPLDRPIVPKGMRGPWARSANVCKLPSEWEKTEANAMAEDNLLITNQEIIAKQRLQIRRIFVPLPPTFTLAMLQSGRPLALPARKHKNAAEILVIFSMPNGQRDYLTISLLSEGQIIDLQSRSSHETAVRCAGRRGGID